MEFFETLLGKWKQFCVDSQPVMDKALEIINLIGEKLIVIVRYISKMRKVFMAIPVGASAVWLALYNESHLPPMVGLNLQSNGEFSIEVLRELAVLGPVAVTALCLLLMFCSRRTLTPWFVSIVSLGLPLIILVTNVILN